MPDPAFAEGTYTFTAKRYTSPYPKRQSTGKRLLVRIVAMLPRMIERGRRGAVREEGIAYGYVNEYGYGEETGQPEAGSDAQERPSSGCSPSRSVETREIATGPGRSLAQDGTPQGQPRA